MTRYELLDRIGVGGMAEIFRGKAVAAGGFEKPVAIKRILPHLSQDQRFVSLLIAEAKVLSLLKHRNIVQIFDVGLGDDNQYFLVMEYVDGKDLGAVQRGFESQRRRMPYDLVLHIGAEICEALEHAHTSRGPDGRPMRLVHRDVSPSNVILSRAGEVKLTDFGIAKRAESEATRGGAVRGKFAYISPEQARNEHLDPRSDVFSVGILLWELFVNRRLFSGLPDLEALRGVREAQIPPPTQADTRLPKAVDQIVMTALAKDPARRFASAGELGAQLRTMRYALDMTVGDPASEIARIVDGTVAGDPDSVQPIAASGPREFEGNDATVIRIRTADEFSERDGSFVAARQVIDRFEDEETRLAQVSDMMRPPPQAAPRKRRAPTDEPTRARAPLTPEELSNLGLGDIPNAHLTPTDETKLVAPRDRRTPVPQRVRPPQVPAEPPPGPRPDAPLTLEDSGRPTQWATPATSPTNHGDAPLTLDDSEPQSQSVSHSVSQSVSVSQSLSHASVSISHSVPSLAHSVPSRAHSAHSAHSLSRSVPPPMTLDGSTPAALPAPLKMPAPTPAPQLQKPLPPVSAPPMPQNPSYAGWGPPMAARASVPPAPAPAPAPAPKPAAPIPNPLAPRGRSPTPAPPTVAGSYTGRGSVLGFKPWMLIVGAVIVALAAFAITRAFMR